jgi:hypothetical protein
VRGHLGHSIRPCFLTLTLHRFAAVSGGEYSLWDGNSTPARCGCQEVITTYCISKQLLRRCPFVDGFSTATVSVVPLAVLRCSRVGIFHRLIGATEFMLRDCGGETQRSWQPGEVAASCLLPSFTRPPGRGRPGLREHCQAPQDSLHNYFAEDVPPS